MSTLETRDSKSTLVDAESAAHIQNVAPLPRPSHPASPFSASFDPNAPTPLTPPTSILAGSGGLPATSPGPWAASLSISLNNLAAQFASASQALAAIPAGEGSPNADGLVIVQQAQTKLEQELESLKEQIAHLRDSGSRAKEKQRESDVQSREDFDTRLQAVETRLDGFAETIRLDQARLYGRLLNSTITSNKVNITPLIMANGKTPQNFPATKGEFEHLTKERYEHLLKSYGLPVPGDTAGKRQAVREFLGLSPLKS